MRRYTAQALIAVGLALLVFLAILVALTYTADHAEGAPALATPARPCGMGGGTAANERLARCLSHEPGIHVDTAKAVSVGSCESGFYAKAHTGSYKGEYQMSDEVFIVWQHQGPDWVDQEFRDYGYGIYSARGNILAAFAHANRYGWGAWSCQ